MDIFQSFSLPHLVSHGQATTFYQDPVVFQDLFFRDGGVV
jgi:hypothetical protein